MRLITVTLLHYFYDTIEPAMVNAIILSFKLYFKFVKGCRRKVDNLTVVSELSHHKNKRFV